MSDEQFRQEIGEFLTENLETLQRTADAASWSLVGVYGPGSHREVSHELLMQQVMWLYDNKDRVVPRMQSGWLLNFVTTRMYFDKYRRYDRFRMAERSLDDYENQDAVDGRAGDEASLTRMQFDHIDCEYGAERSLESVRAMHSAGLDEEQVTRLAAVYTAAEAVLDGHEKVLFRFYFRERRSYRDIAALCNIPKTAVHDMVHQIIDKIRDAVDGF